MKQMITIHKMLGEVIRVCIATLGSLFVWIFFVVFVLTGGGFWYWVSQKVWALKSNISVWFDRAGYYNAQLITGLLFSVPAIVLAILFYRWLSLRVAPYGETRCRKCGYILRGLSEPRCSECGEPI